MKKHIMEDGKWHRYTYVYNKGKTILYVDRKEYKGNCGITNEVCIRGYTRKQGIHQLLNNAREIRVSKCARRKL